MGVMHTAFLAVITKSRHLFHNFRHVELAILLCEGSSIVCIPSKGHPDGVQGLVGGVVVYTRPRVS